MREREREHTRGQHLLGSRTMPILLPIVVAFSTVKCVFKLRKNRRMPSESARENRILETIYKHKSNNSLLKEQETFTSGIIGMTRTSIESIVSVSLWMTISVP